MLALVQWLLTALCLHFLECLVHRVSHCSYESDRQHQCHRSNKPCVLVLPGQIVHTWQVVMRIEGDSQGASLDSDEHIAREVQ